MEFTPLVTQNVRFWQIALKKSACGQNASQRLSGVVEILGPYVAGTSVVTGINPLEVGLTVPINSAARGWARSIGPVSPRNDHRSPQCSTESTNPAVALEVTERHAPQIPPPSSVDDRITTALTDAAGPLPFSELRGLCRVRTASLYQRLAALTTAGRIVKSDQGYRLTPR